MAAESELRPEAAERASWPERKAGLHDDEPAPGSAATPAERFLMVWPLTLQAWGFLGESVEPDFSRDTERLSRRRR